MLFFDVFYCSVCWIGRVGHEEFGLFVVGVHFVDDFVKVARVLEAELSGQGD